MEAMLTLVAASFESAPIVTGMGTIAVALGGVYAAARGARIILGFVRG